MKTFTPDKPADILLADKSFSYWDWGTTVTLDREYPSYLSSIKGNSVNSVLDLKAGDTHFGYVGGPKDAVAVISKENHSPIMLYYGMVFSIAGPATVSTPNAHVAVVSREGWIGLPFFAGPLEQSGRLKYIDGCTDSLLIPPVRLGDPCLNLLYFPPGIDQTSHTHPSDRIGVILSGRGRCHHWDKNPDTGEYEEKIVELVPDMLFTIHTDGKHKFSTPYGEEMRVLAYHPESDFGPQDEDHPMLNRTIVDGGVSAKYRDDIRTK